MNSVCWAALLWICTGCQGEYPIAATRCDELCVAGEPGLPCQADDPAGCVVACREAGGDALGCDSEFEALLACLHHAPAEQLACGGLYQTITPCRMETSAFIACGGHLSGEHPTGPLF